MVCYKHTGPGLVQPVAGVGGGLASLLSNGLVVGAGLLEDAVAVAGLGNYNDVSLTSCTTKLEI